MRKGDKRMRKLRGGGGRVLERRRVSLSTKPHLIIDKYISCMVRETICYLIERPHSIQDMANGFTTLH